MPYVSEQLTFNLREQKGTSNNCPVIRQPSPFLYHGVEISNEQTKTMEAASILAKRDIQLGKLRFNDDDLDVIPVKEKKADNITNITFPDSKSVLHGSSSLGNGFLSHPSRKNLDSRRRNAGVPFLTKPKKPSKLEINIPTSAIEKFPKSSTKHSISVMIDNLNHAYNDLKKPPSQKGYPDDIEQERLQRRVEEQRRHIYRMLYNTKRHVSQLVTQLQHTAVNHRNTVLNQNNALSHLNTAYRSLMSGLSSFIRVSFTLHSLYMTDLKKKVREELLALLKELNTVCNLLDIQTATLDLTNSPSQKNAENEANNLSGGPVQKLDISSKLNKCIPEAPLSPERNESLRAAVKSLITAELSKKSDALKQKPHGPGINQQKSIHMNKRAPNKPNSNKKFIRPKSTTSARSSKVTTNHRRPFSAGSKNNNRPLGDIETIKNALTPSSENQVDPLEVHGNLTPFITEREIARQAWIDELRKDRTCDNGIATPDKPKQIMREAVKSPLKPTVGASSQKSEIDTTMVQLLRKLEEIEQEDEEIRSRWLHIQYSDPHKRDSCDKSPVVLPSAELLEPAAGIIPSVHCFCYRTQLAEIEGFPINKLTAIEGYKDAMLHYLRLTKHYQTKQFDPWLTINNMVDEIMDSLVIDLCTEITSSCDNLAGNIYLSEFIPAN